MRVCLLSITLITVAAMSTGCDSNELDSAFAEAEASASSYGIQIVNSNPSYDQQKASGRVSTDGETYLGSVFLFDSVVNNAGTTYFRVDSPRRTFATKYNADITVSCTTTLQLANGETIVAEQDVRATDFQNVLGPSFAALIPSGLPAASGGRINISRVCTTSNAVTSETTFFTGSTFLPVH